MSQLKRAAEIIATYQKHGWQPKRALLTIETQAELQGADLETLRNIEAREAPVDALWFSRPSNAEREAWELRLVSETQYALFETFEKEEIEEDREDVRREMEARLIEHVSGG